MSKFGRRQVLQRRHRHGRLAGRRARGLAVGCVRARQGSRDRQGDVGLHRADRCLAADHRQGKEAVRQVRHHRRQRGQAGLVGHDARQHGAGFGRRRHRRRAHPDAQAVPDHDGHHDGGEQADADVYPVPPQLRLPGDLGCQGVQGQRRHGELRAAQGGLRQEEGGRQGSEVRHDLPRRHPRCVDPLLDGRRRHRPRQGRLDHRRAAAADGGQHEGRQHGRLLRRRAVGRPARPPGHRLHRLHDRRDLEEPSREVARHARRLGRQEPQGGDGRADGRDGGPAMVREDGEQGRARDHHRQAPVVQRAGERHQQPHQGRRSTTATAARSPAPTS